MSEIEIRTFPAGELRFVSDSDRPRIEGRAIVYDALSEDLGGFREKFAPGSVRLDDDLLALFDHDTSMVLGRASAGTLEASDGPDGVDMTAYPPDTTWARDMRVSMERGDIRHMSFRFIPIEDDWQVVGDIVVRTVTEAEVIELSVVSMPAYPQTSAQARSRVAALREAAEEEVEEPKTPKPKRFRAAAGSVFYWE
jgi:HK97 family phage prohead protease